MTIAREFTWVSALIGVSAACGSAAAPAQLQPSATGEEAAPPAAESGSKAPAMTAMTAKPAAAGTSSARPPSQAMAGTSAEESVAAAGTGGMTARAETELEAGSGGAPGQAAGGSGAGVAPTEKFSFFITSLNGMLDLSKSDQGFGGDLRFGQATGLAGADAICTELAERSMPGAGAKGWHAFLSTAKGGPSDGPIHAKDRIGMGPWYDRLGRLVAANVIDLLHERPMGADPAIKDDLPNERGEPNHTDTVEGMDDNHDVVTGTNTEGLWDGNMTCEDWTSTVTPEMPDMPQMPMNMSEDDPFGVFTVHGPGLGHSWPGGRSGGNWIAAHQARGCGATVALVQTGPGMGTGIGSAGGYGAIYCFALQP